MYHSLFVGLLTIFSNEPKAFSVMLAETESRHVLKRMEKERKIEHFFGLNHLKLFLSMPLSDFKYEQ